MMTPLIEVENLTKSFGATLALSGMTLRGLPGCVHAVLGENGAGKSTLIHLLSGTLSPDSGQLLLGGRDVTSLSGHERVAAGLARSFQITNIFKNYTVLDNLVLALQACSGSSFRFWRARQAETELYEQARALAAECAIDASLLHTQAGASTHCLPSNGSPVQLGV